MPIKTIGIYIERLEARKAEAEKMIASAAIFPYLMKRDRQAQMRSYNRRIYGKRIRAKVAPPGVLMGKGVSMRFVPISNKDNDREVSEV